jgi:hypothetical protein
VGLWMHTSRWDHVPHLRNRDGTGIGTITRDTPDISEWLDFDIYDLV